MNKQFSSKILMFGEYSLMVGSQALSIPYFNLYGRFIQSKGDPQHIKSQEYLNLFINYLRNLSLPIHIENFERDLNNGLAFETNIPIGYGLGSSGALVAAVYDRYALNNTENLTELKAIFSEMESFFHGKSSGLDPLVCYLQQPVWIKDASNITTVEQKKLQGNNAFFLVDSQQIGVTQPLVDYFTKQYNDPDYAERIQTEVVPANYTCINSWLNNDTKAFISSIKNLSQLSLELFHPMIPKGFENLWKKGLRENLFSLKLCGSGGGGMILGFTSNFHETQKALTNHPVFLIQNF
ncbi:MAG: hypothetical protein JXR65_06615 [Bacteroidales bacterium]|nr:hypothetical protein [Bacteroidales bacterium]